jgi:hypothetical protein
LRHLKRNVLQMPFLKYSADLKKFKLIPEVDFEINRPSYSPSYPTVIYRGMDGRMDDDVAKILKIQKSDMTPHMYFLRML